MSNETVKAVGTINFTMSQGYKEPVLSVKVINLAVPNYDLQSLHFLASDIEESSYDKNMVSGIDFDKLNDETDYEGQVNINVRYASCLSWDGSPESDMFVDIEFLSYKELRKLTDGLSETTHPNLPTFEYSANNDGDYLKIRKISDKKLFINVGHCCVSRRMFISPCTLTKLLSEYEIE
jgi:hypothetical protein